MKTALPQARALAYEADNHIEKWLALEPEMETAQVFAGGTRRRAMLWGALLNELLEAVFDLNDAGVAQTKLGWWGQALAEASAQSPHPLVRAFAAEPGAQAQVQRWQDVAAAAMHLSTQEDSPGSVEILLATRWPLAEALVALEDELWPEAGPGNADAVARALVLNQWRRSPLGVLPRLGWLPLQLLARHGLRAQDVHARVPAGASAALLSDLASALLALPVVSSGPRLRRIRTRLDTQALQRLQQGHRRPFPQAGLGVLWHCWRAARTAPA